MTDTPPSNSFDTVPDPLVEPPHPWRPSMIWAIPLLAAVIGLSLVVQTLWQRGPTITVSFASAEGIEPGKTKVKFKNVDIGDVKAVRLSKDRTRVDVSIELVKEAKPFAVVDSQFWVVRPRFAGTGISGLGTLLSGPFIGVDGGHSAESSDSFTGLEAPPVVASDIPGRRFRLLAEDIGSLDVGSPVYFRRIAVGHVESFALEPDGRHIALGIFVKAPYDHFVTTDSRFWHASGVDLRMDSSGLKLQTQSLATVLLGGVAFESVPNPEAATQADNGSTFSLAADHQQAIKAPDGASETFILHFRQSVRGLSIGAPLDFRGVEIGQVRSIDLKFDPTTDDFSTPVLVDIYPDRLIQQGTATDEDHAHRVRHIAELVKRGLRAQLRTGSLLTGQLYVALDFFPAAPAARFDPKAEPFELPTVPSDLEELQKQVQSILQKLDKIPFDTLGQDAHHVMVSLDTSLKHIDSLMKRTDSDVLPEIRDSLRELQKTMQATQATLAEDSPMQQDTRQALRGVAEATRSLKALTDSLDRHPESLVRGKKDDGR